MENRESFPTEMIIELRSERSVSRGRTDYPGSGNWLWQNAWAKGKLVRMESLENQCAGQK